MLYDPNEDKYRPWTYLFFIVIIVVALALCSGCTSRPATIDSDIVEYKVQLELSQERVRELESRVADLQERVGRTTEIARSSGKRLEDIQRGAESITDTVSKVYYLFEQYEYEVQRIIYEICTNGGASQDASDD